jgi:hypothetical protein
VRGRLIGSGELPKADWGRRTVDPQPEMKFAGPVDSNWNHMPQKRFHCNDRTAIILKVTCSHGTASAPLSQPPIHGRNSLRCHEKTMSESLSHLGAVGLWESIIVIHIHRLALSVITNIYREIIRLA